MKQLQLNSRGAGVGIAVGIATGVKSGVATTPGTLISWDGAPGKIGTEGCVSGGGRGRRSGHLRANHRGKCSEHECDR